MKKNRSGKMVNRMLALLLLAASIVTIVPKFLEDGRGTGTECSVCSGGSMDDFGDDVPRPTPVIPGC